MARKEEEAEKNPGLGVPGSAFSSSNGNGPGLQAADEITAGPGLPFQGQVLLRPVRISCPGSRLQNDPLPGVKGPAPLSTGGKEAPLYTA